MHSGVGGWVRRYVVYLIHLLLQIFSRPQRDIKLLSMDYSMHPASLWERFLQWAESRELFLPPSLPRVIVGRYT